MPSPFPGMDPYLEADLWPDVHATLLPLIRQALVAGLPTGYVASLDQYVWLADGDDGEPVRRGKPDTFVSEEPAARSRGRSSVAVVAPTARFRHPARRRRRRKLYIRLLDAADRQVVTVIELLSPSDKLPKADRDRYLLKRDEYFAAGANLVEIDLLRRGLRVPMDDPGPPEADYYLMVTKATDYPDADVWAFTVRDPIPVFPVPLRPADPHVPLDLRACLDLAYDGGGYANQINYTEPPAVGLRGPDAVWAANLLKRPPKKKK